MKNIVIVILLAASVACGGLYFQQRAKLEAAEKSAASLKAELAETQGKLDRQEKLATKQGEKLKEAREQVANKLDEVVQLQQAVTNKAPAAGTNANPMAAMAKIFKDPKMKEMVVNQQKAVLGPMTAKNYAKFFDGQNLNAAQAGAVKDLVVQKALAGASMGMAMMGGDVDATQRQEMMQQMKTQTDAIDGQIKQMLGDDAYTQFQAYEKTIPDRMVLNGFKDQIASGSAPLTSDQEDQLVQAMTQERNNFKFTTDFSDKSNTDTDIFSKFTEDKIATFESENKQLMGQYANRAQNILSPDQATAFQQYLSTQAEMQSAGLKMAQQMFGTKK